MGIVNVTPDSFSDGDAAMDPSMAVSRVREMAADGAAIVDVGAESTRPGAHPVGEDEEVARIAPVLRALRDRATGVPVSVDTRRASVAALAIAHGAVLVNDVTAGADPAMLPLVAEHGVAICLMHMRGEPRTMQDDPRYDDVVAEVVAFLESRMEAALAAGVREDAILLDPGIGFGKALEHNLALLRGLGAITALGRPVVVGASRKGMIGALTGRDVPGRVAGSLGAALAAVAGGAAVVRVHDVPETVDALRVFTAATGGAA